MTIQLLQGDCLVRMAEIADDSVDMILADLPYGTTACKWDNVIPFEPLWKHYWRVLKLNGAVVLFGSEPFSSHLRMSQIQYYKYDWIWEKDKGSNMVLSHKQPLKVHENISVFYKKQPYYDFKGEVLKKPITRVLPGKPPATYKAFSHNGDKTNRKKTTYTHRTKKTKIYFCRESQFSTSLHPTQKPVALLEYLIKTYTLEGETVLDNTMGSGSTGVACVNTGRSFIGIEQDDKYFAIAQQRIAEAPKELWS